MICRENIFGLLGILAGVIGVAAGLFAFVGNIYLGNPSGVGISLVLVMMNVFVGVMAWQTIRD